MQDYSEIVDILTEYFWTVFYIIRWHFTSKIINLISVDIVYNKFVNLKVEKSSGPDNWPILPLRVVAVTID